jgi:hypothetical protein
MLWILFILVMRSEKYYVAESRHKLVRGEGASGYSQRVKVKRQKAQRHDEDEGRGIRHNTVIMERYNIRRT